MTVPSSKSPMPFSLLLSTPLPSPWPGQEGVEGKGFISLSFSSYSTKKQLFCGTMWLANQLDLKATPHPPIQLIDRPCDDVEQGNGREGREEVTALPPLLLCWGTMGKKGRGTFATLP